MSGIDRRDASYTQARETLIRRIDDEGIARMDDAERAGEVRRIVYELRDQYPDLDDNLTRRLMGEGLQRSPDPEDGRDTARDLPDARPGRIVE